MSQDETQVVVGEPPAPESSAQAPGGRIGAYRLLRMLGKGGMGEVWLAERADEAFSKQVAIKFITGVQGSEAGDWFRRERQTMAKLEHPHIARLLDGGETPDGRPFLVMEYVEGVPIDEWCEGKPLERVLDLFLQVCSALEHAHRALIVHRDIKPANVIVTAEGESRLLDFGIARQVATTPEERAEQTTTQAYTLHYASPEQMEGGDITVVSDVYSLGALLYRLLSGRVPHSDTKGALEQLQAIHTTQPRKPSQVVMDNARLANAERRRRARGLHGDLDDIVLKCLRLEPELRYGSARELIDDIGRYRSHRPVLARKGSATYRASRYVRRHWLALAAAAAVLLTLAGGLYSTWLQKQEAERQAALAQKRFDLSRALVNEVLFDFQDELADVPGTIKARRRLVEQARKYLDRVAEDAQNEPGLLADLARAERRLGEIAGDPVAPNIGDTKAAFEHYRRAVALARRAVTLEPRNPAALAALSRALYSQARLYFWNDDLVRSEKIYLELLTIMQVRTRLGDNPNIERDTSGALMGLADVYFWSSKLDLALKTYDRACAPLYRNRSGDFEARDAIAVCHTRRADALAWLERYPEAEAEIATGISQYRGLLKEQPRNQNAIHSIIIALTKQGEIHGWSGKQAASLAAYSEGLELAEMLYRKDPSDLRSTRALAIAYNKRGDAYVEGKQFEPAIADYRSARAFIAKLWKNDPAQSEHERDFALSSRRIGIALADSGRVAEAVPYFDEEVTITRRRWQKAPAKASTRRDLAAAIQDRIEVGDSDQGKLCAWKVEFRHLMRALKDMGAAAPSDLELLKQAEAVAAQCDPAG